MKILFVPKGIAMITLAILISTPVLSGCAMFSQAAEKIAVGVEQYCEQPYLYRAEFRNTINAHLGGTGHKVHVHCYGDPNRDSNPE